MWSNVEIHRSACRNGGGADASPHAHGTASARRWVSKQASSKKQFLACLLGGLLKAERFPRFLAGGETRNPSIADSVSRLRLSIHRRYPSSRSHVAVSVDLDAWTLDSGVLPRGQLNVNVNVTVGSKRRPVGLITEIQIGQRMGQNARHQRIRSRAARQQTSAVV